MTKILRAYFDYDTYKEGEKLCQNHSIISLKAFQNLFKGVLQVENVQYNVQFLTDHSSCVQSMKCSCGGNMEHPCEHLAAVGQTLEKKRLIYTHASGMSWENFVLTIRKARMQKKDIKKSFDKLLRLCIHNTRTIPYPNSIYHIYDIYMFLYRFMQFSEVGKMREALCKLFFGIIESHPDDMKTFGRWAIAYSPQYNYNNYNMIKEVIRLADYSYLEVKEIYFSRSDEIFLIYIFTQCYKSLQTEEDYKDFLDSFKNKRTYLEYKFARIEYQILIKKYKVALTNINKLSDEYYFHSLKIDGYYLDCYAGLNDFNSFTEIIQNHTKKRSGYSTKDKLNQMYFQKAKEFYGVLWDQLKVEFFMTATEYYYSFDVYRILEDIGEHDLAVFIKEICDEKEHQLLLSMRKKWEKEPHH